MLRDDLDRLLAVACQDGRADEVWPAAAAAIEVMWWHDRFFDARALAEDLIGRFSAAPGTLFDQDNPFDEALLVGAEESGDDPGQVVARVSGLVPANSVLGNRLEWLLGALPGRAPHSLISGFDVSLHSPLPRMPFRAVDAELVRRGPATLTQAEQVALWGAVQRAGRADIAVGMHDAGVRPRDWMNAFWLARQLIKLDRAADATAVLLGNLDLWFAEHPWHVVPSGITTQPDMRTAVTPELREAVLSNVDVAAVPGVR